MSASASAILSQPRLVEDFVPSDYSEMFRHYYGYILKEVIASGIDWADAEDVSMNIVRTFIERDALTHYSADFVNNSGRRAVFRTFLSGFVRAYLPHFRKRQIIRKSRDAGSLDESITEDMTLADVVLPTAQLDLTALENWDLIDTIRKYLAYSVVLNEQDKCDLALLFEFVLIQVQERGEVNCPELADLFQVTRYTVNKWMKRLRIEVEVVLAR